MPIKLKAVKAGQPMPSPWVGCYVSNLGGAAYRGADPLEVGTKALLEQSRRGGVYYTSTKEGWDKITDNWGSRTTGEYYDMVILYWSDEPDSNELGEVAP